ncbi:MAG: hypothetical protein IT368_02770 [Candidatus Hydrogenedentes bacterium]|nr:hypothetical protein [Candidatus Hydrogenedentota bacterium]
MPMPMPMPMPTPSALSQLARQLTRVRWPMPWRRNLIRLFFGVTVAAALLVFAPGTAAQENDSTEAQAPSAENRVFTEHDVEAPAAAQDDDTEFSQDQGRHEEEWYDPTDWIDADGEAAAGYSAETDFWDDDYTRDYNNPYRSEVVDTPDTSYYDPHFGEGLHGNDYRVGSEYDDASSSDYYTDDWYDDDSAFNQWYNE